MALRTHLAEQRAVCAVPAAQPDGKVALLDFGQCKALSSDERRALCGLYLALRWVHDMA